MQPDSHDDNQHRIYDTLWRDPHPSSDNLNIVNSKSYKEYGLCRTDLIQTSTHALPTSSEVTSDVTPNYVCIATTIADGY